MVEERKDPWVALTPFLPLRSESRPARLQNTAILVMELEETGLNEGEQINVLVMALLARLVRLPEPRRTNAPDH